MTSHLESQVLEDKGYYTVADFNPIPGIMREQLNDHQLGPIGAEFASAQNAFQLHKHLSEVIHKRFNIWIAQQPNADLGLIMANIWRDYLPFSTGNMQVDMGRINRKVLEEIVPQVSQAVNSLIYYVRTVDRVPYPAIERPVAVNQRGANGKNSHNVFRFLGDAYTDWNCHQPGYARQDPLPR